MISLLAARRPLDLLADSAPSAATGVTTEAVTWTQIVGCAVDAPNTLRKTAPGSGWGTAGAVSTRAISSGNGYVEATMVAGLAQQAYGLSNGDSNANYTDIDFGVTWLPTGALYRVRNATVTAIAGATVVAGNVVRVAVVGADIQISINGVVKYTWVAAGHTYPLLLDAALLGSGTVLAGATISGLLGASGY